MFVIFDSKDSRQFLVKTPLLFRMLRLSLSLKAQQHKSGGPFVSSAYSYLVVLRWLQFLICAVGNNGAIFWQTKHLPSKELTTNLFLFLLCRTVPKIGMGIRAVKTYRVEISTTPRTAHSK